MCLHSNIKHWLKAFLLGSYTWGLKLNENTRWYIQKILRAKWFESKAGAFFQRTLRMRIHFSFVINEEKLEALEAM